MPAVGSAIGSLNDGCEVISSYPETGNLLIDKNSIVCKGANSSSGFKISHFSLAAVNGMCQSNR